MGEDGGAILGADIIALAVQRRGVMGCKENVEQVRIADDRRVIADADRFGMAGRARADLFIGRVGDRPADITALDALDALEVLIDSFRAPESAPGQRCDFLRHDRFPIHVWLHR